MRTSFNWRCMRGLDLDPLSHGYLTGLQLQTRRNNPSTSRICRTNLLPGRPPNPARRPGPFKRSRACHAERGRDTADLEVTAPTKRAKHPGVRRKVAVTCCLFAEPHMRSGPGSETETQSGTIRRQVCCRAARPTTPDTNVPQRF